jgi:hypothetical protein
MSDSPQGWQYPQLPSYPQGQGVPGAVARNMRPPAMRRAVQLMYAGAAVALIAGIVDGLTTHNVTFYTYNSASRNTATVHGSSSLAAGIVEGVLIGLLWLWMSWKTGTGRGWARVLSTVFFCFACLGLIGAVDTVTRDHTYLAFIVTLVSFGVGLGAITQLWQRESSEFFAFAKQAKRDYGYQPPPSGSGQPPSGGPG